MPRPEKVRLGEILLQQGLLTDTQLQEALDEQKKTKRKLGRVFVEKGFVSEEQISTALARQLQVPFVNLKHFSLKPEIAMQGVGRLPKFHYFGSILKGHFRDSRCRMGPVKPWLWRLIDSYMMPSEQRLIGV